MGGFIVGENRYQAILFSELLDDYITDENPGRMMYQHKIEPIVKRPAAAIHNQNGR